MVAARKIVNLEENPDLVEVARAVMENRQPVSLREAGEEIAVIAPSDEEHKKKSTIHTGVIQNYRDVELMKEIHEIRNDPSRPHYQLPERSHEEIAARSQRLRELAGTMPDLVPEDFIEENYKIRGESTRYLPDEQ